MTLEKLLACTKEELPERAEELTVKDIGPLVSWLGERDDHIRYPAFLLLRYRSRSHGDVYPYWDVFAEKLRCANSYQRSIGLQLMAHNARWDEAGRMDAAIDEYLSFCDDEKPVVVRLCIQSLEEIVTYKPHLSQKIQDTLLSIDIAKRKETQRKLVLLDIISVLTAIRRIKPSREIDGYLFGAMGSGYLDKKAQKEVERLLVQGA